MSQTYTHKDLARKLKVSETTIKSYRRKFPDCIPVASQGKPIRFLPEAFAVCSRIRDFFDLGMSVEEVQARLAEEFSWISLVARKKTSQPDSGCLPQDFTIAISNLSKSMVTLLQQQNSIMERMANLEAIVEVGSLGQEFRDGAVQPADFKALLEDLQGYLRNALMPLQQLQRLNSVQGITDSLHQAAANMVDAAQIMRSLADKANTSTESETPSKVVQFPGTAVSQHVPAQPGARPGASQDPPRVFLLKPMVVRTVDGGYISAGGKTRGRFTLNDFKALLVYGRQPGEYFSLHWEQRGNDWFATLVQTGKSGKWYLQLKEAMSQSGVGVVELVGFMVNEEAVHPAEFVAFVAGLAEGE
jgi:hypothetical protein